MFGGKGWHSRQVDAERDLNSAREPFAFINLLMGAFLGFVAGGIASIYLSSAWSNYVPIVGLIAGGLIVIALDVRLSLKNSHEHMTQAQARWDEKEAETQRKIAEMQKKSSRIPKVERK
ncbi:hypothetical protein ATO10_03400 [Actibacterium atlanticum]|uniref:Uncharacterized protein n=1 Tax=Actibacterium atlanticum TaxID=1461693 RepID=A0A058ZQE0_9RHOB|nr:hypothetical protein [Actibacterium atlanticum]KCV83774.1 hypothetical protein ATO10_03400 [Actibacterium atlanticum]